MALDHSRLGPRKQIRPNFLRSISLLYKILPTSLGTCKPTFYTFYTSHLRWNSTMRRCFYHTDLGQQYFTILKYKLHSFNIQDDQSTQRLLAKPLKKIQNHLYGQPVASCGVSEWKSIELPFNIIKNLSCLFFILWFYNDVQSSKMFDTCGVLSAPANDFMNDWKQTTQQLKLQERLLTIHKRNIIRWNIYTETTIFIHEDKY